MGSQVIIHFQGLEENQIERQSHARNRLMPTGSEWSKIPFSFTSRSWNHEIFTPYSCSMISFARPRNQNDSESLGTRFVLWNKTVDQAPEPLLPRPDELKLCWFFVMIHYDRIGSQVSRASKKKQINLGLPPEMCSTDLLYTMWQWDVKLYQGHWKKILASAVMIASGEEVIHYVQQMH